MVKNIIIEEVLKQAPTGFEVSNRGGTVRYIEYGLLKAGADITRQDMVDSLNQMISAGQLVEDGYYNGNKLYRVAK